MIGYSLFQPQKRALEVPRLNLVAMIDILTIMVFFLLINQGDAPKIENAKFVDLPKSVSGSDPHAKLIISVNRNKVWIGDQAVADIADILKSPDQPIASLAAVLAEKKAERGDLTDEEKARGLDITIMGDKSVSYTVLKSVMATCQGEDYRHISLAVNQVVGGSQASATAESTTILTTTRAATGG